MGTRVPVRILFVVLSVLLLAAVWLSLALGPLSLALDDTALAALLAADGPALLHVAIDTAANVWPLVPPNHNNAQMLDADEVTSLDVGTPAAPAADTAVIASKDARHALPV